MALNTIKSLVQEWRDTAAIYGRLIDRHESWASLKRAGGGTAASMIRADFGTDNPIGLEIKPWPDRHIDLKIDNQRPLLGYASGANKFSINTKEVNTTLQSLQFYYSFVGGSAGIKLPDDGTFTHEFEHTNQFFVRYSGWVIDNTGNEVSHLTDHANGRSVIEENENPNETRSYYLTNEELQARLSEIMVIGYAQWQKMPLTKTELWASLYRMGFEAPDAVINHLENTTEGQKALSDFRVLPSLQSLASDTVSTFNDAQSAVDYEPALNGMWENLYPSLYGVLLEHYGDVQGRVRMDMGVNPRPVIDVMFNLKDREAKNIPLTDKDKREIANSIPANLASAFINNAIELKDYNSITSNSLNQSLYNIIDFMLDRDDVHSTLFDPSIIDIPIFIDCGARPPLMFSALSGNVEITELLLLHNPNIEQSYRFHHVDGLHPEIFNLDTIREHLKKCDEIMRAEICEPSSLKKDFNTKDDEANDNFSLIKKAVALIDAHSASKKPIIETQAFALAGHE